ncbi:hypothetical protein FB45DRAFT_1002384 [Roridomyces roridus]|uniref:Small secreted protein n=1 Tax=Roridomyces roridus TaxID=1738132 RepID=A0AAD7BZG5_9AGAR|nr:hypothetical protein FB45DRAFT_1002384 [Roridomyces roridus]
MARFALLFALLAPALTSFAAPVPAKRAFSFALQSYDQFQISDGVGGTAEAEANAVFVNGFPSDLSTVDATSLDNLGTMREAAESAETDQFDPEIDAASGAAADALQVGKIKNKVLKLTGEVQQIKIKIAIAQAAGSDTSDLEDSLTTEQTKLTTNIALDVKNKGLTSQGVTGGSTAAAATTTQAAAATSTEAAATDKDTAAAEDVASTGAAFSFALLDYSQFQISDGEGGNAEAEANAVFVTGFPTDLSTVDATSLSNLQTMREAAESAETDQFDPEIDAASGAAADALQVGKIKNKVLKLTGEVQGLKIQLAQAQAAGKSTTSIQSQITAEQTKLTTNIALDVKNKGAASQGVA